MVDGSMIATIISALIALAAAIYAGRAARRNRREQEEYAARTPTPPTTQQVWERLDMMDRKMAAVSRILREAAEQWPRDMPGPTFRKADLDLLDETLPPQWRHRYRHPPERRSRGA